MARAPKMHYWMIQNVRKECFFDLGLLDWLDVAYYDKTSCFPTFGNTTRSWRVIQKLQKSVLNDPTCQKRGVAHFLDLGLLDRLVIAYYDRTKCSPSFRNTKGSWRIVPMCLKCIFEWSVVPKSSFLVIFLTLNLSWSPENDQKPTFVTLDHSKMPSCIFRMFLYDLVVLANVEKHLDLS